MARIEIDPNYSSPTFSRATASTDLFKKEDVQALAAAISTHVHDGAGKGLSVAPAAGTVPGSALANGSVTLGKLAADSVDSSKIVDGTIGTADLANAAVTNAKLAADTARANLLTNGGFEIWQRGAGPFATTLSYTADRWVAQTSATSTMSVSRDGTNIDIASGFAVAATHTAGGGGSLFFFQKMEANWLLASKTISLSVRVRCSQATSVRAYIDLGGTVTYSAYHSGGGAYETLTVTYTNPASVSGLALQVGVQATQTGTFYVDNAMLVVGSVAADYAPLHPADDLARCLRYYEVIGSVAGFPTYQTYGAAGQNSYLTMPFKAKKAVTPTVTKAGTWTVTNCAQPATASADTDGFSITAVTTALGMMSFSPAAGCTIVSEGNP